MGNTIQSQGQVAKDETITYEHEINETQISNASPFSSVFNSTKKDTTYSPVTKFGSQERVNPFDKNNSTIHNEQTYNKIENVEDCVLSPNEQKNVTEYDNTISKISTENRSNILETSSSNSENIIKCGPKLGRQLSDADIIFGTSNKIMLPNRFTTEVEAINYQIPSNQNEYFNL